MKFKLTRSLILLICAAFSFFANSALDEQPIKSWVEPKNSLTTVYYCTSPYGHYPTKITADACYKYLVTKKPSHAIDLITKDLSASKGRFYMEVQFTYNNNYNQIAYGTLGAWDQPSSSDSKICPPDGNPSYTVGPVPESDSNSSHLVCKPKFTPCPLGYFPNAVSSTPGQPEQCVPIQCPSKGTQVNNIKNFANVIPLNASGTYCDGQCNYSIQSGGITTQGQQFATGVSLGSQCGQSPVKGQKWTPIDQEKNCVEHTLSTGASFLECKEGTTDTPVPDTSNPAPNVDNAKVPETPVIDPFTGVECTTVDDKLSCVGKNITDAITKQTKDDAKLAAQRHNKLVEQQKDITNYVETQNQKRELARQNDAQTLIQAVQQVSQTIINNGGSGGSGGGAVTVTGFAGLASAVDGIADGLNGTDVETDSVPSSGLTSFYEPEYPNGFRDVWDKNQASLRDSAPFTFVSQFSSLNIAGTAPPMEFCFNLGSNMNFGCKTLVLDPRIFGFLYAITMISAAFACRKIVFGG